jgi:hypothetical protein
MIKFKTFNYVGDGDSLKLKWFTDEVNAFLEANKILDVKNNLTNEDNWFSGVKVTISYIVKYEEEEK